MVPISPHPNSCLTILPIAVIPVDMKLCCSFLSCSCMMWDFPGGPDGKASVYNVRDLGSIPGLGRFPGEGNGNPLQYSCLENPMDRGAWCRLLSLGSQRVGHDWATSLYDVGSLMVWVNRSPCLFPLWAVWKPYFVFHVMLWSLTARGDAGRVQPRLFFLEYLSLISSPRFSKCPWQHFLPTA